MALEYRLRKIIKEIMSNKSVTYSQVAQRLGISESSVKRAMTKKKMTVVDFELYCKSLSLNPYDVFLAAHDNGKHVDELSFEQEDFLCRNPTLDYIFLKLGFGFSQESLRAELAITKEAFRKLLSKIERYGLLRAAGLDEVVFLKRPPFKWIKGGPFEKTFGKLFPSFVLKYFLNTLKDSTERAFLTAFEVYLKEETYAEFQAKMKSLVEEYRRKSRSEMSMVPIDNLKPYAFVLASDQVDAWREIILQRSKELEKT